MSDRTLIASNKIKELRSLQSQLALMIHDGQGDESIPCLDNSTRSTTRSTRRPSRTLPAVISGLDISAHRSTSIANLDSMKENIEAGMRFKPDRQKQTLYTPKTKSTANIGDPPSASSGEKKQRLSTRGPVFKRPSVELLDFELGSLQPSDSFRRPSVEPLDLFDTPMKEQESRAQIETNASPVSNGDPKFKKRPSLDLDDLEFGAPAKEERSSRAPSVSSVSSSDDCKKSSLHRRGLSEVTSATADTTIIDPSSRRGRMSRSSSFSKPSFRRSRSGSRRRSSIFNRGTSKKDLFQNEKPAAGTGQLPSYDFLAEDNKKDEVSLRPGAKWWHGVFLFSTISMLACIITLWAPYPIGARMPSDMVAQMPWSTGCKGISSCICPRETICADDLISMIFLTISRSTAWFDYPLYMLLFMSKAQNLNNFLQKTALRCWINFSDYHKVHSLFGIVVGVESMSHSFFHILRWARRNDDIRLLWTHPTGITGLVALVLIPFIVLPMSVPFLKKRMSFEWRKGLHYLSVVWGVALMYHAPERIFWLIGVPLFIYAADKAVEFIAKTHLIESAHFQRLGDTSCIISFENPPGFGKQNSAYVYLMLPWLSKSQFHAFTVFPCTKPNHSSICISKCGDWTGALMKQITTPTHKPAFVVGPFLSPFSSPAMDSENLVAVASGIGVTPAISLIKQYLSTSRRLNLVWICRDAGLVEHFLTNCEFTVCGYTLIYYTGKRSIVLSDDLPPNVFIFNGRPNLERTISGIIHSIVSGVGLPEELYGNHRVVSKAPAEMRTKLLLEKALSIYSMDQLFDYTVKASNTQEVDSLRISMCGEVFMSPLATANYQGVLSTMKHLLGDDCEQVLDILQDNFEKINPNGSCLLNREEFEKFMKLMLEEEDNEEVTTLASVKRGLERINTCKDLFDSKVGVRSSVNDEFGIKIILQGDGKFAAKNWNMLYCGGSEPVLSQLKAYKRKYAIALSVEKFDW